MSSVMFKTLESTREARGRRRAGFVFGFLIQTGVIALIALVGILFPQQLNVTCHHFVVTWLPDLTPVKPVPKPPRVVAHVAAPKIRPPAPEIRPVIAKLVLPKIQKPAPPTPPVLQHVPEAPVVAPPAPQPALPKPPETVHTGTFDSTAQVATTKRPADQVQTGGFGSPDGLPGRGQRGAGNVPVLGAFNLPDGPGKGNGTGGSSGVQGTVASAGFGSGVGGGNGHGGSGLAVSTGGFTKVAAVAPAPSNLPAVAAAVNFEPIEILSKPTPVYTEEARRLGIQGEVALSVVFEANGSIRVLGVVKSLGHGLDQAAEVAAGRIRFKPALQDGKPADFPATLRIQFRLADQNS